MAAVETPDVANLTKEQIEALSPAEQLMVAMILAQLEEQGVDVGQLGIQEIQGPQSEDELWQAVYDLTGYRVPRKAVCKNHHSPLEMMWEMYSGDVEDALWIGNRGGGKTTLSGFLHGAKCRYNPKYESTIAGAMKLQSKRAYAEFQRFIGKLAEEIIDSIASETKWAHGSKTEVIGGTIKQLNGPHPHFGQFDEVELTTILELEEFENMPQGDALYPAQSLLTSSRKKASGLVQALVNEIREAIANGNEPPRELRIFCVWETVQNVPNCMNGCGCENVVKGHHPDGTPRTFADMCDGKLKLSDGFVRLKDARKRFLKMSKRTWEAQQECKEVALEGIVHYWWDPELYGLQKWFPRAEFGPVYRSWDWGGTNPHSVHWSQVLKVPVEWEEELLPEGTIVTFDELHYSDKNIQGKKGFGALGERVFKRTEQWRKWGFPFEVDYDFCDPAGAAAKSDVKEMARIKGYPIPRFKSVPAPLLESVEKHVEWGDDGLIRVVIPFCPFLVEGYEDYSWPERKPGQPPASKPIQVDDHAVDDDRYKVWNLYKLGKKGKREGEAPAAADHETQRDAMKREEMQERGHSSGQGSPVGSSARNAGYIGNDPLDAAEAPTVRKVTAGRLVR